MRCWLIQSFLESHGGQAKQNDRKYGQGDDLRHDHVEAYAFNDNAAQDINKIGERQHVADKLQEDRQRGDRKEDARQHHGR